jgi:hypothetical protein
MPSRSNTSRVRIAVMLRLSRCLVALLALLLLLACPSDDDDSATVNDDDAVDDDDDAVDDDDSGTADDDDVVDDDDSGTPDDDDAVDDDDSGAPDDDDAADDDDSAIDCSAPPNVAAFVSVTDPTGNPSTVLTTTPLTITVSVRNLGGGTETQTYNSGCIYSWQLDDGIGGYLGGGPDCPAVVIDQDYACGAEPVTQSSEIDSSSTVSGDPLAAGTYWLSVDTYFYGVISMPLTVP